MCFGALTDGDATDGPVAGLLRAEMGPAARQGAGTGLAVLAVLLVAGVAVLRWRVDGPDAAAPGTV